MYKRIQKWLRYRAQWPPSKNLILPRYTSEERRELIRAFAEHPGWTYIMAELENAKAAAEHRRAETARCLTPTTSAETVVRELIRLDEGIFWLGWIEDKVRRVSAMPDLHKYERPQQAEPAAARR